MNLKIKLASAALCLMLCVTASAQKVTVDWDKSANFSSFKTFAYLQGTPTPNQLMDQRIVNGIEQQLALKGLQKVDLNANPDLIVSYQAAGSTKTQINTVGTGAGVGAIVGVAVRPPPRSARFPPECWRSTLATPSRTSCCGWAMPATP